jgi:hypothetical protein
MRLSIERKPVRVNPDPKRVIARFFFNGNDRAKEVLQRVMGITRKLHSASFRRLLAGVF